MVEEGKDFSELMVDQSTKEVEIEAKGKVWKFAVRKEIARSVKNKCISEATSYETGKFRFDLDLYNRLYLKAILTEAPFPVNLTTLASLGDEIGKKLEALVAPPFDVIPDEALKKE